MSLIGVIANRTTSMFSYIIILVYIYILFFFKLKIFQINIKTLFLPILMILILFISYMHQKINYSFNNMYYIQFFGSQAVFFLILSLFGNILIFKDRYLEKFLLIIILLIFMFVLIDYILINSGFSHLQAFYRINLYSYENKPLGLFGQFSVNTSYIVVFYMLLQSYNRLTKVLNISLISMILFVLIIENSGTGYMSFILLIFSYLLQNKLYKYLSIGILITIYIIIYSNILDKISIEYIDILYKYFIYLVKYSYMEHIDTYADVIFGLNGNLNIAIDFGPMFMIAKIGLLYTVLYIISLLYLIYRLSSIYAKMAIITLMLGNIHYPVLFYPIMNIFLPIIYIITIQRRGLKSIKEF